MSDDGAKHRSSGDTRKKSNLEYLVGLVLLQVNLSSGVCRASTANLLEPGGAAGARISHSERRRICGSASDAVWTVSAGRWGRDLATAAPPMPPARATERADPDTTPRRPPIESSAAILIFHIVFTVGFGLGCENLKFRFQCDVMCRHTQWRGNRGGGASEG